MGGGGGGSGIPIHLKNTWLGLTNEADNKEIKGMDSSNQTKEEVLREPAAITGIGDHWGIPHLFGVWTGQAPHYLVLHFHALDSQSVTLLKAASEGVIQDVVKAQIY